VNTSLTSGGSASCYLGERTPAIARLVEIAHGATASDAASTQSPSRYRFTGIVEVVGDFSLVQPAVYACRMA
jgi:hypothetical protein